MQSPRMTEKIEWSRSSDLPSVEILLAENCSRLWHMFHDTYGVCIWPDIPGQQPAEWKYRRKTHLPRAGDLGLVEPGEVHITTKVTGPAWFRVLLIDPSIVARAASDLGVVSAPPHLKVAQLSDPALFRTFAGLHASLERPETTLERQSRFATCLRLLLERCTETSLPSAPPLADHPAVQRARAFIHEHVTDRIGLEELVAAAGSVSRFHLVRVFTAEVGLPPHAYQIHLRIAWARELLAAGMRPADVAVALDFADQSHFTRHFHRIVGVTPAAFVRATAPRRPAPFDSFSRFAG